MLIGPALKGPFLKGKRTFWKNRLCSKLTTSLAEDEIFLIGIAVDKILLYKWKNSASMFSNFSGVRAGVNGAGVKLGPTK